MWVFFKITNYGIPFRDHYLTRDLGTCPALLCMYICMYVCMYVCLLGWHWPAKLHRFQVYNSTLHHLCVALCAHHHFLWWKYVLLITNTRILLGKSFYCLCHIHWGRWDPDSVSVGRNKSKEGIVGPLWPRWRERREGGGGDEVGNQRK